MTELLSDLLAIQRDLDLSRERCRGTFVCERTAEFMAVSELNTLILFFCLANRSLLRRIIGGERVLSPNFAAELASIAPELF